MYREGVTKKEIQRILKPYIKENDFQLLWDAIQLYPEPDQVKMLQHLYCAGWEAGRRGKSLWEPYFDQLEGKKGQGE